MISGIDVVLCDMNVGKSGPKCLSLLWSISREQTVPTLYSSVESMAGPRSEGTPTVMSPA